MKGHTYHCLNDSPIDTGLAAPAALVQYIGYGGLPYEPRLDSKWSSMCSTEGR